MPTFRFNKLVRDNFRPIYDKLGQTIRTRELSTDQLKDEIRRKIIEEAKELPIHSVSTEEMAGELADIQQAAEQKRADKGGFDNRIYNAFVEIEAGNPSLGYYRARPDQYPEVK